MAPPRTVPSTEELARQLVEVLAPEELPTFAAVAAPYLEDARRAERRLRQAHDDPLGFGLGDVAVMATPVIALVSGSVVTALSDPIPRVVGDTRCEMMIGALVTWDDGLCKEIDHPGRGHLSGEQGTWWDAVGAAGADRRAG